MITKRVETGMISILVDGALEIRDDFVIEEDGIEISRTFVRSVLNPSADTSNIMNLRVKLVADLMWTPEVVTAYAKKVADRMFLG